MNGYGRPRGAIWLAALLAAVFLAGAGGPAEAGGQVKLPPKVAVGQFSGPGGDSLVRALKKYAQDRGALYVLDGRISLTGQTASQRETVPVKKPAGEPVYAYKPDQFTKRVWLTREVPQAEALEVYPLERFTGNLTLDWRLTAIHSGVQYDQGRVAVDLDRVRGGYLAELGLAPPLSTSPANSEKVEAEIRNRLTAELVRLMALELGRYPESGEIEAGEDPLSRQARNLALAGDWEGARQKWLELLALNPDYAPALFNLGLYHERARRPEAAWRKYRAAFLSQATTERRRALTRLTESLRRAGRLPGRQQVDHRIDDPPAAAAKAGGGASR